MASEVGYHIAWVVCIRHTGMNIKNRHVTILIGWISKLHYQGVARMYIRMVPFQAMCLCLNHG